MLRHQAYLDTLEAHTSYKGWGYVSGTLSLLSPHLEREPLQELQHCTWMPRKLVSEMAMLRCIHARPVHANAAMHDPFLPYMHWR